MKKLYLHIKNGPLENVKVLIKKTLTIGRNSDNDIIIKELSVSRYHAKIIVENGIAIITDCNSTHGIYINDKKCKTSPICHNDRITIGGIQMVVFSVELSLGMKQKKNPQITFKNMDNNFNNKFAINADVYSTSLFDDNATYDLNMNNDSAIKNLKAIYKANEIISSENNLDTLLEKIKKIIDDILKPDTTVIFFKEKNSRELVPQLLNSTNNKSALSVSSTILAECVDNKKAIVTNSKNNLEYADVNSIILYRITSAICAPLLFKNEIIGVIYLDTRTRTKMYGTNDLELLVAIAGPATSAIRNAQYMKKLEQANHETTMALANAIELRDHYTVGHTYRVTNFSVEIAKVLGWEEDKIEEVRLGGILHDIGKIAVDDAILCKPTKLTNEEFEKMKIHPARGAAMIENISYMKNVIPYCLYHHEKYDGTGYPYGLKGEDIPIEGRVISVADAFDAMTSNRPYRKGLSIEIAINELQKGRDTQFDSQCVDAMLKAFNDGKITNIMQNEKRNEMSIACPFCSTYIEIPQGLPTDATFLCSVCKRKILLQEKNMAFYGVITH